MYTLTPICKTTRAVSNKYITMLFALGFNIQKLFQISKQIRIYTYNYSKKKKIERKGIKKNHINFAHPKKLLDSLASLMESPSVVTKIATNKEPKVKFEKIEFEVASQFILKDYGKTEKIKQGLRKLDFRSRSWLRVGKVLAPYNTHPKMIPLIKYAQIYVVFKIFNSLQNNKTLLKKQTKVFFFWAQQGCTSFLRISIQNEKLRTTQF